MQLCSSSPSSSSASSAANPNLALFLPSQNPRKLYSRSKLQLRCNSLISLPPCSYSKNSAISANVLDQASIFPNPEDPPGDSSDRKQNQGSIKKITVSVRRPLMDSADEVKIGENEDEMKSSAIDAGLEKFARKLPIFEPDQRVESAGAQERPLKVNLDLALYKAKVLARKFRYEEAEKILEQCINSWPEDGRPYVMLGNVYRRQSKISQARALYEKGCQATLGENSYIWQCWAVLENKMGNVKKARELFDAATVADKRHVAAWHGWAVLEMKCGNTKKARQLLAKGLKFCGGNEYIYQTLAMLEAKANRLNQARYLFRKATKCNPKSCPSWLAWALLEVQQENNGAARLLFEKAVQASPKNRFAWQAWGVFEANMDNVDLGRKLLKIGHALNPRDAVILQSLALLEYKHNSTNLARVLFRRASELDPRHQPIWIAWGWMEWKEGNIATAREYYQKVLSINSTNESAARCLQAWGVLEQRAGNLSAARRLFRSSLNINSQSYITWMTWASMEEDQGNAVRAEEIRNLYFQQRTEVVDDASWAMGFSDVIDPALDSIKRFLNFDPINKAPEPQQSNENNDDEQSIDSSSPQKDWSYAGDGSSFNVDAFIKEKLSIDVSKLDDLIENANSAPKKVFKAPRRIQRLENPTVVTRPQPSI